MPIGLKGNTDGSGAIQIGGSDAISISTGLNTTFAGTITATGTVAGTTGTLYPIVAGTAVASTSGTAIDFTGIPSWVRRITVMFSGVSTNGSSNIQIQLGDAGGIENTGYLHAFANTSSTVSSTNFTSGFGISIGDAGAVRHGVISLNLIGSNIWACSMVIGRSDAAAGGNGAGSKTLSDTLDRVRITTVNGTDTFDAGTINLLWE